MSGQPTTAERARQDAARVRDRLTAEGRHRDAAAITRLIRASATSSGVNSVVYRDNRELRERLKRAGVEE